MLDVSDVPPDAELNFRRPEEPLSIVNAMCDFQAMADALRDGPVNATRSTIPESPQARADHLKAFAYFCDVSMVGIGALPASARRARTRINPDVARLAEDLRTRQTKTLASGIDLIMADLRDSMAAPPSAIDGQNTAIALLQDMPRDPAPGEPGCDWLQNAQAHRACLRATETAVVLANYIRLLGWNAKAHTATSADIELGQATVAAGLATVENNVLANPFVGSRFGVAVITTDMDLALDAPLAPLDQQSAAKGWTQRTGADGSRPVSLRDPFAKRRFVDGPHPFETLKRVSEPTTYIDATRVARVPKRTDMFARAQFGDMGKKCQDAAAGGHYVRKAAPSSAQRRLLGALVLLQDGAPARIPRPADAQCNADALKAASYFLGIDAVGLSECPDWAWYSHDAIGEPIVPSHDQAVSMIVDQGFETMEGASGDDWISVAQSMRAYLRFSLLGGVIAQQIRNLGYHARVHTVMDGEVLQPPLLLLSGLGEVSRIGEVILNPFLGPRLKSGVVTTDLPIAHDRPIDFGLQAFCEACNKCARECPSGAITAGPKTMFNGYEIWKSDSQKCATYRMTTEGGAMCGRCMKTCPWNLEGLFAEAPFRWAGMNVPRAAPALARLDDALGRGGINPIKKWWWDIELGEDGAYHRSTTPVNARGLQKSLKLDPAEQTLAVYPAPLAPPPWPYPSPMDREAGIEAYQAMITAEEYKARRERGETGAWDHHYSAFGESPVLRLTVVAADRLTEDITLYRLAGKDGADLPVWQAGAHLDIVVSPDKIRQYSLCGDPSDRKTYSVAVLRELDGRGGSKLLHWLFTTGRRVFVSKPINHFPLAENARHSYLMGGGIGVTPMIAMAHTLHLKSAPFELHYSVPSRRKDAFSTLLAQAPWSDAVHLHVSDEGSRVDLSTLFCAARAGDHVYACGPNAYMQAVQSNTQAAGLADEACHSEHFSVPELPPSENHPFTLELADGRQIQVSAHQSATDALAAAGIAVDVKCSDGICGVCKCGLLAGQAEHRDFVLSKTQRAKNIILCQSRAAQPRGVLKIDL